MHRKTRFSTTLSTINPTWIGLASKPVVKSTENSSNETEFFSNFELHHCYLLLPLPTVLLCVAAWPLLQRNSAWLHFTQFSPWKMLQTLLWQQYICISFHYITGLATNFLFILLIYVLATPHTLLFLLMFI
jgi:hypothetical protein